MHPKYASMHACMYTSLLLLQNAKLTRNVFFVKTAGTKFPSCVYSWCIRNRFLHLLPSLHQILIAACEAAVARVCVTWVEITYFWTLPWREKRKRGLLSLERVGGGSGGVWDTLIQCVRHVSFSDLTLKAIHELNWCGRGSARLLGCPNAPQEWVAGGRRVSPTVGLYSNNHPRPWGGVCVCVCGVKPSLFAVGESVGR